MGAILSSRSSHSPPGPKNGLIYCFVARGTGPGVVVLAEYKPLEGNFHKIGLECAKKLAAKNHSITYTCNHTITYTCDHSTTVTCEQHTFNFLVKDKFTYLVVAEESFPREIPLAFLVRMKDDFREKFPDAYKAKMKAHSLDKRFRPIMKKHVTFCVQHHLERLDQVANIQNQLEEVKALLRTNIYKVMDRHERLEVVVEKAEILANLAEQYRENTNTLRKKFWWQNMKVRLFVLLLILAVVIWLSICHDGRGFNTPACNQPHLLINLGFRFLKSSIDFFRKSNLCINF
ncbi:vesicle-associated membrane protein 72 [Marchantia polymorpha subsp. ruderalis]|uniref:Vesicle-associated membrane protein 72D n=1 Tax=Marchantia polymorpha TaxID=3197 RepID=A0A0H5BJC9_MARPO|nr:vesicle-associated membrane protein 72D [Marchantia polymorpha]BBN19353.1 hypothetical protein Mp_8g09960 [Marchantia polymorpha subsp. ruderalis]